MPHLKITTNQSIASAPSTRLLAAASKLVATQLGKSEQYMMVTLDPPAAMLMGGSDAPCAFLELRAIGLPTDQTSQLAQQLCQLMETELGTDPGRVYINFADVPPHLWGWNSDTF